MTVSLSEYATAMLWKKDVCFQVDVFECDAKGNAVVVSKSRDDLARLKLETELPIRDFRIFFHRQQGTLKDC